MRGYLRLDLADNCNIRCVMCQAYNGLPLARVNFFDFNLFRERTRGQLSDWSTIQLGNIAEATIHPKFADYLRFIRSESDATIHIVTNGKLLHRYADLINETGNCLVQVSMDSVRKEMHEYIREGSDYDRLVANLNLLDVKRTRVLLSFTLMNSNIGEYDEMVEFCRARGFAMSAFPMILRDEDSVIPWRLLKESLWFNANGLRSWLKKYYGEDYGRIVQGAAPGTQATELNEFNCRAHHLDLAIYNRGKTVLCGKQDLGSLAEMPLDEMWNSEAANEFRRQVDADRSPCMTCDYRQRCLAPSMSLLANHFNERIATSLQPETQRAIAFDREISDEAALDRFVRDVAEDFAVFDIARSGNRFEARRVYSMQERGPKMDAPSQHELQALMAGTIVSPFQPRLLQEGYGGHNLVQFRKRYWGLPQRLGPMNLSLDEHRRRPGVLQSESLSELKALINAENGTGSERNGLVVEPEAPFEHRLLEEGCNGYNLVQFGRRFWGLPQTLGPMNLNLEADRGREGVLRAESLAELRALIDNSTKGSVRDDDTAPLALPAQIFAAATSWISTRIR